MRGWVGRVSCTYILYIPNRYRVLRIAVEDAVQLDNRVGDLLSIPTYHALPYCFMPNLILLPHCSLPDRTVNSARSANPPLQVSIRTRVRPPVPRGSRRKAVVYSTTEFAVVPVRCGGSFFCGRPSARPASARPVKMGCGTVSDKPEWVELPLAAPRRMGMHVAFSRPASACGCAMATPLPAVPPCEGEGRLGPPLVNGDGDRIPGFPSLGSSGWMDHARPVRLDQHGWPARRKVKYLVGKVAKPGAWVHVRLTWAILAGSATMLTIVAIGSV